MTLPNLANGHHTTRSGRHQCTVCQRYYHSKMGLTIHHRIHSGVRPFECDNCGRKFNQHSSLTRHLRIHAARPRQFQCTTCGRHLSDKENLLNHLRLHTGELPLECDECGRRFRQRTGFQLHLTKHRGDRPQKKRADKVASQMVCLPFFASSQGCSIPLASFFSSAKCDDVVAERQSSI